MKLNNLIADFVITFVITFFVSAAVTFLYNLLIHDQNLVEWATSVKLALIFGITLPWLRHRERSRKVSNK